MNTPVLSPAAIAFIVFFLVLAVFAVIVISRKHTAHYRSLKNPVKTIGMVTDVVCTERLRLYDTDDVNTYCITYTYTDSQGNQYTNHFFRGRKTFEKGEKITLYYESENPQNSITDFQYKSGRDLWWKVLLTLAVMAGAAVLIVVLKDKVKK